MNVHSPRAGTITKVLVRDGELVGAEQIVLLTEMMKMVTEIKASHSGTVSKIMVAEGDMVEEGQLLFTIDTSSASETADNIDMEGNTTPDLISELQTRREAISDAGRSKRIAKRHQQSGRSARENIADLFDAGSFNEIGGHVLAAQHSLHDPDTLIERSAADGVITGTGTINGIAAAALVVDYTVMAGTQGFFHHKKIDRLLELVERRKLPLLLYPEGGGGRPNDVDAHQIAVAQLEIMTFKNLAALKGNVPMIAVVHGYCFAGSAALAAMADVIIATESASIGMGGPAMIEGGGLGVFKPEEVGPAAMHAANGTVDIVCADEAEATRLAKQFLAWMCSSNQSTERDNQDSTNIDHLQPADRNVVFDMREIIEAVFDAGSFVELKQDFAKNLIAGIAKLDGKSCGILANFSGELGGAIDGLASQKAAGLIEICNQQNIPLVSLVDTPGFMVGPEAEQTGQIDPIGDFFTMGARFKPPLVPVIIRRAYGLGAMAMAGGSLHASDTTLSWPTGEFGAMGIEGAVRLGMRDKLAAILDDKQRKAVFDEMVATLYEKGKAINAATFFEIDDIITPSETRSRLIAILNTHQA